MVDKQYSTPDLRKQYEKNKLEARKAIEQNSLQRYIQEARKQNEEYFELKARELLSRDDKVSKASNELLFKELNVTPEEIMRKFPDYKSLAKTTEIGVSNQ